MNWKGLTNSQPISRDSYMYSKLPYVDQPSNSGAAHHSHRAAHLHDADNDRSSTQLQMKVIIVVKLELLLI